MPRPRRVYQTLPCPFCGGYPILSSEFRGERAASGRRRLKYLVECDELECPANPMISAPRAADAVRQWNSASRFERTSMPLGVVREES